MSRLFLVLVALTLIAPSGAEAGIVVIDMRRPDLVSAAFMQEEEEEESEATAFGGEEPGDDQGEAPMERSLQPRDRREATFRTLTNGRLTPPEQKVDAEVEDAVATQDELMGCGGAQAIGGPAGLLPIALALLATLLGRRRKLHSR